MDDLRTRAQLVDFDRAGGIGTVITRAEITEAAAGPEFPATLLLDLDRADARARVAVDWDQETLEQLLASTEDDEIGLWFNETELAMAFDDVEGHGIREKAAVLAIAVVAAGATTATASARLASEPWGDGTVAPVATMGAQAGAAEHALQAAQSPSGTTGNLTVGTQAGAAERALQANESPSGILGVSSFETSAPDPAADKAAVVGGTERGLVQDQHISQNLTPHQGAITSSADSGTSLSTGEVAGVVAGGALLIAAAGFGMTRKRMPPGLPA